MRRMKYMGLALIASLLVLSMVACDLTVLDSWLSSPYGYVKTMDGQAVEGATVTVYRTSVSAANMVQSPATTISSGYFSLTNKVDTTGGTYIIVVTPPTGSSLVFDNTTVEVPTDGYLYNIGTIKANGLLASVSGRTINAMAEVTASKDNFWEGVAADGTTPVNLTGATITLTKLPLTSPAVTKTGTVSATGTFDISGVAAGTYRVSGSKLVSAAETWTFIEKEVVVTGTVNEIELELLAYPVQDANTILLITHWTNPKIDVDGLVVIDDTTYNDGGLHIVRPSFNTATQTTQYPIAPATAAVKVDRDVKFILNTDATVTGNTVETIRIFSNPLGSSGSGELRYYINAYEYYDTTLTTPAQVTDTGYTGTTTISGGTLTGNPDAGTYTDTTLATLTQAGFRERAGATAYIMKGSTLFGSWPVPINTGENNVGIARITFEETVDGTSYVFYSFGQDGTIRSLNNEIVPVGVPEIR